MRLKPLIHFVKIFTSTLFGGNSTNNITHNQLRGIYNFLSPSDSVSKADLIIGFGHFDMRIVDHCAQLFEKKFAPNIIFSGGVGAGSADFTNPEAIEFRNYLHEKYPNIPLSNVLIESNSTNTGENVRFTIEILKKKGLLNGVKRVILVATPTRQLRVLLTAKL